MSELDLRTAIADAHNDDSAIQTITGRTSFNMIAWGTQVETNYPIGTYRFISGPQFGGTSGRRRIRCEIEWWTDADDAYTQLEALMDRSVVLMKGSTLNSLGVDVNVSPADDRRDGQVSVRDDFVLRSIQNDFLIELQGL